MSKLKTYTEFVNEGMVDAIKNPIKWKKIKNNAKKFQKAKVAQALNDVDYAKRKAKGAKDLSSEKKEILKQANLAKNSALKDTTSNIGSRMDDLATTPGLKQVVKLAKTKSNLAANQIVLKSATGEEAKQLKIKQKQLTKKAADAQQGLKDYESSDKPKDEESKTPPADSADAEASTNKDAIKKAQGVIDTAKAKYDSIDAEDKAGKIDAEIAFKQAQQKKATLEDNKELIQGLGDDIGELMTKKRELGKEEPPVKDDQAEAKIAQLEDKIKAQDKIQVDASAVIGKLKGELKLAQNNKNTGRSSQADADAISDKIQQATEDKKAAKTQEDKLKKELKPIADKQYGESYTPLVESVSDKFKRLRPNL